VIAERTASTALAHSSCKPVVLVAWSGLGDAAMVLGDLQIEELAAPRFEAFERTR
jgi:hypothetical protein